MIDIVLNVIDMQEYISTSKKAVSTMAGMLNPSTLNDETSVVESSLPSTDQESEKSEIERSHDKVKPLMDQKKGQDSFSSFKNGDKVIIIHQFNGTFSMASM